MTQSKAERAFKAYLTRRKNKKVVPRSYTCKGGPFDHTSIWTSPYLSSTLQICVGEFRGYYLLDAPWAEWVEVPCF